MGTTNFLGSHDLIRPPLGSLFDPLTFSFLFDRCFIALNIVSFLAGCDCNGMTRFYWPNVIKATYVNGEYRPIYSDLLIPEGDDVALVVKSFNSCPNLCICDEDGVCYQSGSFSEVHFLPTCTSM